MVSPKSENLVRFAGPNEQRNELERCRRLLGTGLALIGVVAVYLLSVLHLSRRFLNSGDASLAEETVTRIAHHLNDRRMQLMPSFEMRDCCRWTHFGQTKGYCRQCCASNRVGSFPSPML